MSKKISRKLILLVVFVIASAQIFLTLAYYAGFSFAQTASTAGTATSVDITSYINNAAPYSGMTLNGTEVFKANVTPSTVILTNGAGVSLAAVGFYLDNSSTSGIDAGLTATNDGANWTANLSIYSSLSNGTYDFYAKAFYGNYLSAEQRYEAEAVSQRYTITLNREDVSCTGLNLILNDGKTTYNIGEFVNYTWVCYPGGFASNVSIWLHKPDSASTFYNSGSGSTQTMGFSTSNLTSGTYILKACFDSDCKPETVYASQTFTIVSTPTPTPTPTPTSTTNTNITTPYLNAWIESVSSPSTIISGTKNAGATSTFSFPSLTFYLIKIADSINYSASALANLSFPESGSQGMNWSGLLNTANISNGSYYFYAKGFVNGITTGTEYTSNHVHFAVNNSVITTPSPSPSPSLSPIQPTKPTIAVGIDSSVSGSAFSGTKNIWAKSNLPLTGLTFKFYNTASGGFTEYIIIASPSAGVAADVNTGGYNYWSGVLDTAKLLNGGYKLIAKGVYNGYAYENITYFYFNVNNPIISAAPTPIVSPAFSPVPIATSFPYPAISPEATPVIAYIPDECRQKGYTDPEACQKYFQFPWECRQQNILDGLKCQEYMFKLAMPEICRQQGAVTQEDCAKIVLLNSFPQECKDANIIDEAGCVNFMNARIFLTAECKEANISDFSACGNYMAEKFMPKECADAGAKSKEECDYIMRNKYGNFAEETLVGIKTVYPQSTSGITQECQAKGITDPDICAKEMAALYLPEECKSANILTAEDCQKFLYQKRAPEECLSAKISDPRECEKFMFTRSAPQDCAEAGMTTPETCKRYMFDKYNGVENVFLDKFPIECQKAGLRSASECEKIMRQKYLPESCKSRGLTTEKECALYIKQKSMPKECQAEEAKDEKECNRILFKKFAPDECKKAGISEEKECDNFLFNLYASRVTCDNISDLRCKNLIKENYLGSIAAKQAEYAKVKSEIAPLAGGDAVSAEEIKKKMGDFEKTVPIRENDASIRVVKAEEKLVLSENNDLIQTAGAAVMIDADNDGLTDDMEKRIGTSPFNSDSDGDGYKDGYEVKSGFNPLGEGKVEEGKIAPIDEAILNDQILSQPKADGVESDKLSFDKISNVEGEEWILSGAKYLFAGKAYGDSVVTVYIYSDLPIVVTAKTDKYGNWNYEFDKSLMDGEHEAYVVLSDNTGKVVAKSKVMNFFVKEAKAMTVKDFISSANAAPVKESEKVMSGFTYITLGIIILGIIIFIGLILILNKRNNLSKPRR